MIPEREIKFLLELREKKSDVTPQLNDMIKFWNEDPTKAARHASGQQNNFIDLETVSTTCFANNIK